MSDNTEETEKTNEEVAVDEERYSNLMKTWNKYRAEGWMDVIRRSENPVEIRPVDRQEHRREGQRIESDTWLVREENGDTYTVSEETLDSEFIDKPLRRERFVMDLSYDGEPLSEHTDDTPDHADIETEGWDIVADIIGIINVRTQTVISMDVENVRVNGSFRDGGIPVELMDDHPDIYNHDGGSIDD